MVPPPPEGESLAPLGGLEPRSERHPYCILSIDAGGMRALIPARILEALEHATGQPISALFDLIAGSGTGALLALGLATPGPNGQPRFSAREWAHFFREHHRSLFVRESWDPPLFPGGPVESRYSTKAMEESLQECFGDLKVLDSLTDVLIPAYDLASRSPMFYRSRNSNRDAFCWEAARAAMATPTFFNPFCSPEEGALVGGAVFAPNPALCAYAETLSLGRMGLVQLPDILLISLGTGKASRPIPVEAHGTSLHWARPLLSLVLDGGGITTDFQLKQLLPPNPEGQPRYIRLQVTLDQDLDNLDTLAPAGLEGLERVARRLLVSQAEEFNCISHRLSECLPNPERKKAFPSPRPATPHRQERLRPGSAS